jgi:hypothetical protein
MFRIQSIFDIPIDWNDKMTLFLILFAAGLICVLCAVLLAVYLLKSDRFTSRKQKEPHFKSYKGFDEESRLSRLAGKLSALFRKIKRVIKRSKPEFDDLDLVPLKEPIETLPEPPIAPPKPPKDDLPADS